MSSGTARPPIAIVGIGAVLPGCADLPAFWSAVRDGRSLAREVPRDRWAFDAPVSGPGEPKPDHVRSRIACLVDDFKLNLDGLDIDPEYAASLDPMNHFTLHAGRDAWRDAKTEAIDRSRVGVVMGNIALPTESISRIAEQVLGDRFGLAVKSKLETALGVSLPDAIFKLPASRRVAAINRYVTGLPAGLLCQALGLDGERHTLDAACASSLYALKFAVDELQAGRADAMLAGGLSRPDSLYTQMGFSQLKALSPSGRCAPFDADADGLVVGEGCGMFLLKRLDDAIAQGDRVYAVVRGIGLSNDIGGNLFLPDSEGQLRAMTAAYEQAGWTVDDVELIECHGTGTPIGDGVELDSLRTLRAKHCGGDEPASQNGHGIAIGSVKSNVGHLLTGAGAAGLLKVLLAMSHGTLPPTANYQAPATKLNDAHGFEVLGEARPWQAVDRSGGERRAAISAFGFGGINAHLLLESWDEQAGAAYGQTGARHQAPSAKQTARQVTADAIPDQPPDDAIAIVGLAARVGDDQSTADFIDRAFGASDRNISLSQVATPVRRFRIPPTELRDSSAQQLLMLNVAADAVDDASLADDDAQRVRTGVFIGLSQDFAATNYRFRWTIRERAAAWLDGALDGVRDAIATPRRGAEPSDRLDETAAERWLDGLPDAAHPPLTADRTMGNLGGIVASRVARALKVGGPSFALSTEAGSGLTALASAARLLRLGEIDTALVGAVDIHADERSVACLADAKNQATSGAADGAAALVLKRLGDAVRDGDTIYAVLDGNVQTANPDEHLDGETDGESDIATGLYDLRDDEAGAGRLGDCGAARGLIAAVRGALALHSRMKPDTLASADAATPWLRDRADGPRRASIATRSIDGAARRVTLREATECQGVAIDSRWRDAVRRAASIAVAPSLFVVRGSSIETLQGELRRLATDVEPNRGTTSDHADLTRLAANWRGGSLDAQEASNGHMLCLVATSVASLLDAIDEARNAVAEQRRCVGPSVYFNPKPLVGSSEAQDASVALVYPGAGNQYDGMGKAIARRFTHVLENLDAENDRLASQFARLRFWHRDPAEPIAHKDVIFGQVWLGCMMHDVLGALSIKPGATLGYSLGETTSLFATRAWPAPCRDEMLRRMDASSLFVSDLAGPCDAARAAWQLGDRDAVRWLTGVVDRDAAAVRKALAEVDAASASDGNDARPRAYLLIVNAPKQCVVGGDADAVQRLVTSLGCGFIPIEGATTVHCDVAHQVADAYRKLHVMADTRDVPGVTFYSSAKARTYKPTPDAAAESILAQAMDTVDFTRVIERAYADGVRVFVEVGPGGSCSRMIAQTLGDRPHFAVAACDPNNAIRHSATAARQRSRGDGELASLVHAVASLAAEGVAVDFDAFAAAMYPSRMRDISEAPADCISVPVGIAAFDVPALVLRQTATPSHDSHGRGNGDGDGRHDDGKTFERSATPPARPALVATSTSVLPSDAASHANTQTSRVATSGSVATTPSVDIAAMMQPIIDQMAATQVAEAKAQATFLALSADLSRSLATAYGVVQSHGTGATIVDLPSSEATPQMTTTVAVNAPVNRTEASPGLDAARETFRLPRSDVFMDYDACMRFAVGSIASVLGERFAPIDAYPTRVRLPDEPLMLAHRVMSVEGPIAALADPAANPEAIGGRVVTEHDIIDGAWYLDHGRIPTCIAVEAGQADLFLSGYLGIDFRAKGDAVYRLLDAVVTFHSTLPAAGATIHYDIRINRFFRQGQTHLFRFEFDATVNGQKLLTMRDGCAGFFTKQELDAGQGIVQTAMDRKAMPGEVAGGFAWLAPRPSDDTAEAFDDAQLNALRRGDLAGCFGDAFVGLPLAQPAGLPGGRMTLVHRVLSMEPTGGRFGLGQVVGEADIHPDDWFLTCHFVDDMVMPGTLMYECCLHTMRVMLLRWGWVGDAADFVYEPIPDQPGQLKCRGQVQHDTKAVQYEITVKEVGYRAFDDLDGSNAPSLTVWARSEQTQTPYVIADALMYGDGRPIVQMKNMSLRLSGLSKSQLEAVWAGRDAEEHPGDRRPRANGHAAPSLMEAPSLTVGARSETSPYPHPVPDAPDVPNPKDEVTDRPYDRRPAIFDYKHIYAFANGKPSDAFGDRYRAFDGDRVIARLPRPPYQLTDRIVSIDGCEPWVMKAGGVVEAQYDVPPASHPEGWYFPSNRQAQMPFAVLLEIALQPCGWLAAYVGSALTSETDLHFRNLGGKATLLCPVTDDIGTLTTRVKMTGTSASGGMVIQHYDMHMWTPGRDSLGNPTDDPASRRDVYKGTTYFGFFSDAALANQIGIREVSPYEPTPAEQSRGESFDLPTEAPFPDAMMRMVDRVDLFVPDGGPHGLGYVRGVVDVDPQAWFFQAHFFQDPVWPGSLGLESFMQLLKVFAWRRWGEGMVPGRLEHAFEPIAIGEPHTWSYRGQVLPTDHRVTVSAVVKAVDDKRRMVTADGFLVVDNRVIYQMTDFSLRMPPP